MTILAAYSNSRKPVRTEPLPPICPVLQRGPEHESKEQLMTRATSVDKYPKIYLDLLAAFETGLTELVIPFQSKSKAHDFRLDFYSFRAAMEKEGGMEMYPKSKVLMLQLRGDQVVLKLRDHCDHAIAIDTALKDAGIEK